jgi:hypothetical protein
MEVIISLVTGPSFGERPAANWQILFEIGGPGWSFAFAVAEPFLVSLDAWRQLAAGTGGVCLYRGTGGGSIGSDDRDVHFIAQPSLGGGDVTASYTISRALVTEKLDACLDEAVRRGDFEA